MTRSIPISEKQSVRSMLHALREAREEIKRGGLVCIFPEGQITRTGMLLPFRRGLNRITKELDEPIIPMAIDGAIDSSLSLHGGRFRFRFRSPWPRRALNVAVGDPLPSGVSPFELRRRIMDLMVDAFAFRKKDASLLHREAFRSLRRNPLAKEFFDPSLGRPLSNARMLAAIVALGRKLRVNWKGEDKVGILLPPSIAAAAVNVAASAAGKVTVNLNYTVSHGLLQQISDQCKLRLIITSSAFIKKAGLDLPAVQNVVCLEDLSASLTGFDQLYALIRGLFQPLGALERFLGRRRPGRLDDTVTMLFSSGSTGVPKGVPLTHWNLWSNITGACQQIHFPEGSRMLGMLPFFHAFGTMAHLWLPLMKGIGVAYCPNPVDGPLVGGLTERHRVTHLLATPTFLSIYARRVPPAQFGSLTFVMSGAEKLRPQAADAFESRFGLKPVEGYGCTECAPVVTMSTVDHRSPGIFQQGSRKGSIGHPLPGVTIRIKDLETGEDLEPDRSGMMLVKGHNVMQGYFELPLATNEVLRDGWYVTGDVAQMDEDGFVTITDRLSRFSKIGGEMVPHIRIEEALHEGMGMDEAAFAVTGIPDAGRGERLAVLHTLPKVAAHDAVELLQQSGLPRLWIPKATDFIRVDALPCLGSGKLDLMKVRDIAADALSTKPSKERLIAMASRGGRGVAKSQFD
jgi:acyl-[acyl-carrier-protein]-phospholipid O-acyltransferase/long-chain-fatty-acid--[acyl-carrier-protein] ligase